LSVFFFTASKKMKIAGCAFTGDFCESNLCLYLSMQLVQFLLKQAGVDKRTGDLYGNRDLLNIARNMARGLKVGRKACPHNYVTCPLFISYALIGCRVLRMYTPNTSLCSSKPWKEL
jgi:hypothetical protein